MEKYLFRLFAEGQEKKKQLFDPLFTECHGTDTKPETSGGGRRMAMSVR